MKLQQRSSSSGPPKHSMVSSSPGRAAENTLPAPGLARLFRGKSSGRTRPRSSPMIISRSKSIGQTSSSALVADADAEPSSPKVTCIGQVRIRKSRNKKQQSKIKNSAKAANINRTCCHCVEKALLCRFSLFRSRKKKKKKMTPGPPASSSCCSCRPCIFFFCCGCCFRQQQKKAAEEAPPSIAFVRETKMDSESEQHDDEEAEEDEETKVFVSSSSVVVVAPPPPLLEPATTTHSSSSSDVPKNALLLMRCRSAPHNRSSALALSRFPVSPVPASESEADEDDHVGESGGKDEDEESRCSSMEEEQQQPPVGLMRCKSEPAKSAEKLMRTGGTGPTCSPPPSSSTDGTVPIFVN